MIVGVQSNALEADGDAIQVLETGSGIEIDGMELDVLATGTFIAATFRRILVPPLGTVTGTNNFAFSVVLCATLEDALAIL